MQVLWVGLGGFAGAVLRWLVGGAIQRASGGAFPLGTLVVNVLGCFALGWLCGAGAGRDWLSPQARSFLTVGLLGGFTTFSTFAWETFDPESPLGVGGAFLNVALHLVLGVGAVAAGFWVGARTRGV